jgi:hypothetical protein
VAIIVVYYLEKSAFTIAINVIKLFHSKKAVITSNYYKMLKFR